MSAPSYVWIIVYSDGRTETKEAQHPCYFADMLEDVPIAIIRSDYA